MAVFPGWIEVQSKGPNGTTAMFGYTRNGGKTWHGGIDMTCPDCPADNTPVLVAEGGQVVQSRIVNSGIGPGTAEWGNYVTIMTDTGYYDIYAHLASRALKAGERVSAGELVGVMGSSGNAKGGYKHLHFERRRTATGAGIDPSGVLGIKNAVGVYGGKPGGSSPNPGPAPAKPTQTGGRVMAKVFKVSSARSSQKVEVFGGAPDVNNVAFYNRFPDGLPDGYFALVDDAPTALKNLPQGAAPMTAVQIMVENKRVWAALLAGRTEVAELPAEEYYRYFVLGEGRGYTINSAKG